MNRAQASLSQKEPYRVRMAALRCGMSTDDRLSSQALCIWPGSEIS